MRTLGLLSPFSGKTHEFFLTALHQDVRRRSGAEQDAKVIAMGFNPSTQLLHEEKWWTLVQHIKRHIRELAAAGAEAVLFTSLVWYRFADELAADGTIPVLHPVDALMQAMRPRELEPGPLGILAPELVTDGGALIDRFRTSAQREIIFPTPEDMVSAFGPGEYEQGPITFENRRRIQRVLDGLRLAGATGIVACTPAIAGLISAEDFARDCYHLPALQVASAAEWMLRRSHEKLF